ncbi:MAG: DUF2079 domain-containing protein [Deltaproteobacteria bacterium]|nr:DUF2079 domain-containing protein [Deltaproteobacteria bacterium]
MSNDQNEDGNGLPRSPVTDEVNTVSTPPVAEIVSPPVVGQTQTDVVQTLNPPTMGTTVGNVDGQRDWVAPVVVMLARLALIGFGIGSFVGSVRLGGHPTPFMVSNVLEAGARSRLVLSILIGTALAVFSGAITILATRMFRRRFLLTRIEYLDGLARRLAPLALLCFVPWILRPKSWEGRDLPFVVLALMFGVAAEQTAILSLKAPPALGLWGAAMAAQMKRGVKVVARYPSIWVLLGTAVYVTFFSVATIRYHRYLYSTSFDLALEENILWNIVHGGYFFRATPMLGPTGTSFGLHATLFSYPLAGIYAMWPRTETVLILQAAFMGGAALPLYLLARRKLGGPGAAAVAICYLLYPPLHGAALYDFHYPPLAPFFMWTTLFLVESRRYWLAIPFLLLTLSIREDIPAGVAIFGVYLAFTGERPRAGLWLTLLGTAWFVTLKFIVMPRYAGHEAFLYLYEGLVPPGTGGGGFSDVIKTVVSNPSFTLGTLLNGQKLEYVLLLFVPLLFIPLRRPISLLLILPGFIFTLLSVNNLPLIQISFQYTTHWTMYVFVGLIAALSWIRDTKGLVAVQAALLGLACATFACSYQFGGLFQQQTVKGGFGAYKFTFTAEDEKRREAFAELAAKVPPKARISSAENLVPHFAHRKKAYTLRVGIFDADYIMFSVYTSGQEATTLRSALENRFGIIEINSHFGLAKRGYDKSLNADFLKRL